MVKDLLTRGVYDIRHFYGFMRYDAIIKVHADWCSHFPQHSIL
jgi:hypothetical protein